MKVSIIMASCNPNREKLDAAVKSILNQTYKDYELIIVDDGSTKDRTAEIADEYAKKYPSIVKAVHQENGGHGEAVNTGLKNATGLYFKVVDSDDWVDIDAYMKILEKLRQFKDEGSQIDMVLAN